MLLTPPPSLPLVLDLDGTVLRTDTFHEMMAQALRQRPWILLFLPFWLWKGRAFAKVHLTEQITLNPSILSYNNTLLNFLREEAQKGRPLILATGSPQKIALVIADHLGLFQEVIGSDEKTNMTGQRKCNALLAKFGPQGFDYAGDSLNDAHIWKVCSKALVVHPKYAVLRCVTSLKPPSEIHVFPREVKRPWALIQTLRPLFWGVNLVAFSWPLFIAWGLLTSGLLIAGDLLILPYERKTDHRPSLFAKGHLHLSTAFILSSLFIFLSLLLFTISKSWIILSVLLLYIPVFMGLDSFTRPFHPLWRWIILGFGQLLALRVLNT